jgi:hypothetical protein
MGADFRDGYYQLGPDDVVTEGDRRIDVDMQGMFLKAGAIGLTVAEALYRYGNCVQSYWRKGEAPPSSSCFGPVHTGEWEDAE